jgi:hypothetical protein
MAPKESQAATNTESTHRPEVRQAHPGNPKATLSLEAKVSWLPQTEKWDREIGADKIRDTGAPEDSRKAKK